MGDLGVERHLTRKGAQTRRRILDEATRLIAERGVWGTSTDDVRRAASVSGSQLYHYFDSKQALVRAVITQQADSAAVLGRGPAVGALDDLDALRAWADAAIERVEQTRGTPDCELTTLAGELRTADEGSRQEITAGFLRWKLTLTHGLQAMRARGDLRADTDLDALAYALLAALQGGQQLSRTLGSTACLRAALDAAICYVESHRPTEAGTGRS